MLIGRDFDKIEFSFLGLDLLEPNAFIGDTIILITAIIIAFKIKKFNHQNAFLKIPSMVNGYCFNLFCGKSNDQFIKR